MSVFSGKWGRFGGVSAGSSDDGRSTSMSKLTTPAMTPMRGQTPLKIRPSDIAQHIDRLPGSQQLSQITHWDAEMDTIDKAQEQLVMSQYKVLRSQLGTLTTSLSEVKCEVSQLKGSVMSKDVEPVIENMVEAHNTHDKNHANVSERVGNLESFLAETSEKLSKETKERKKDAEEAQIAQDNELGKVKGECHQHAQTLMEKQAKELETTSEKLNRAVEERVSIDKHILLDKKHNELDIYVKRMQQLMEELTAKHEGLATELSAKHEKQIAKQEALATELAAKHAELAAKHEKLIAKHEGLASELAGKHEALATEVAAKHEELAAKHAGLATEVASKHEELAAKHEKQITESSKNHQKELADHIQNIETRFANVESLYGDLNDVTDQQKARVESIKTEVFDALKSYATSDTLERTLGSLRTSTQVQLEGLEGKIQSFADQTQTQLEGIEGMVQSSDAELRSKLGEVDSTLGLCARMDKQNSMEQSLSRLERSLRESNTAQDKAMAEYKITSMESQSNLEAQLTETVRLNIAECNTNMVARVEAVKNHFDNDLENAAQQIKAASTRLGNMDDILKKCVKSDQYSSFENSVQTRIDSLQTALQDSSEDTNIKLEALEAGVGELAAKQVEETFEATTKERLEKMEHAVSVQHALQIESAQSKLMQLEADMKNGVEKRISLLEEKRMTDSADNKACYEFHKEAVERRFVGMEARQGAVEDAIQQCSTLEIKVAQMEDSQLRDMEGFRSHMQKFVQERVEIFQKSQSESNEEYTQQFTALEAGQMKLRTQCEELNSFLRSEASAIDGRLEARCEETDKRVANLQFTVDAKQDVELLETKLRNVNGRIEQQHSALETTRLVIERRCENLENKVFNNGSDGWDIKTEMDQRVAYMQEDIKRQREMMEASLLEQLRQEHATIISQASVIKEQWDREVKARQAYMDSYKELLAQERNARERAESSLELRLQACESKYDDGLSDRTQTGNTPGASVSTTPAPGGSVSVSTTPVNAIQSTTCAPTKTGSVKTRDPANATSPRPSGKSQQLSIVAASTAPQTSSAAPSPVQPSQSVPTLQTALRAASRIDNPQLPRSPRPSTSPRPTARMMSMNGTRVAASNSSYQPSTSSVRLSPATSAGHL